MHNPYETQSVRILDIKDEGSNSKLFALERPRDFQFGAGSFLLVSLAGFGEAPFGICSNPNNKKTFEFCVREVGKVTEELHKMKKGDKVGIRGPYGHGFPLELAEKRNLLIVVGGIGLEPLRPAILEMIDNRDKYGKVQIFYGAKTEADLLFRNDYESWVKNNIDLNLCLEKPSGKVKLKCPLFPGLVTALFDKVVLAPDPIAFLCGPPMMFKFVLQKLEKLRFRDEDIYLSLERRMHCGVGVCQHCAIGGKYVCKNGPVFSWAELKKYKGGYSLI
jgi:sulfhydrogenase subunit gamma (sulfur reductase)